MLGISLAGLVNMLNPARVVLGGHLASSSTRFVATIIEDSARTSGRFLRRVRSSRSCSDARRRRRRAPAPPSWRSEPILADPASWFNGPDAVAGPLGHRSLKRGTRHMSKLSRAHRSPRHASGEETRMHVRRTAALIMGAALVLVAACDDDVIPAAPPARRGSRPDHGGRRWLRHHDRRWLRDHDRQWLRHHDRRQ